MFRKIFLDRLRLIFFMLAFIFFVFLFRLSYLQLLIGPDLKEQAVNARNYYLPGELHARGNIVDRNGRNLTNSETVPALLIVPAMISENGKKQLATILNMKLSELEEKIVTSGQLAFKNSPRIIKYGLSYGEQKRLTQEKIKGVYTIPITVRYGKKSLARHLVGYLQHGRGVKGIEKIYNGELKESSPDTFWKLTLDARGNVIPGVSFEKIYNPKNNSKHIVLTLDTDIQRIVENVMDKKVSNGTVVIMDPYTGDILAAASRPNYVQQELSEQKVSNVSYINKAFLHYHPGSIYKILVTIAALEEEIVKVTDEFICNGSFPVTPGVSIKCWNEKGHGRIDLKEAIALSCNSVIIEVALKLGRSRLLKYSQNMGITESKIIGYPTADFSEVVIDFGPGKVANAALGQEGIRLTPVQVAVLLSCIANGGKKITPRIVKGIVNDEGEYVKKFPSVMGSQILKRSTVEKVHQMLLAVNFWGTGKKAWSEGWGSAGKTGSAQTGVFGPDGREIINAWYAGYAPLSHPEYVAVILIEDASSGGEDAAPVFKEIMNKIIALKKNK